MTVMKHPKRLAATKSLHHSPGHRPWFLTSSPMSLRYRPKQRCAGSGTVAARINAEMPR